MNITRESYNELLKRLNEAQEADKEIIIEIEEARKQGDLSENADYSAAMDKKRSNDNTIANLKKQIEQAVIVEGPANTDKVSINTKVVIEKIADHSQKEYQIGDSISADPDKGIISEHSPIGKAIINHSVGDVVLVETKKPYSVKIISIKAI